MPSKQQSAQDLAGLVIDNDNGTTALRQAAANGTLKDISGVTAALLATVKDHNGKTPLHYATNFGHLVQIPGVSAEFLATVKNN